MEKKKLSSAEQHKFQNESVFPDRKKDEKVSELYYLPLKKTT